jgi:uncharacterized membrane protein
MVAGRRREIGVRLALGARQSDSRVDPSQAGAMTAAGTIAGIAGASLLARA